MELPIKGTVYNFCFGIAFYKALNVEKQIPIENFGKKDVGFRFTVAQMLDGDITSLLHILDVANKTESPRLKMTDLEDYIDSDECDIDSLFKDVEDFLSRANACKKEMTKMQEELAKQKAKSEI